jgi:hypothetical protein
VRKRGWWKWVLGGLAAVILVVVVVFWDLIKVMGSPQARGFIEEPEQVAYQGDSHENLKAIRTALLLYHDNEDRFPMATGWMDAIKGQLRTGDLKDGEELKKLKNPKAGALGPTESGYAMNSAFVGKFKDEGGKDSNVLVFESADKKWDAVGMPSGAGREGITLGGEIVKLK